MIIHNIGRGIIPRSKIVLTTEQQFILLTILNKMKGANDRIISIYPEGAFDTSQHTFITQTKNRKELPKIDIRHLLKVHN